MPHFGSVARFLVSSKVARTHGPVANVVSPGSEGPQELQLHKHSLLYIAKLPLRSNAVCFVDGCLRCRQEAPKPFCLRVPRSLAPRGRQDRNLTTILCLKNPWHPGSKAGGVFNGFRESPQGTLALFLPSKVAFVSSLVQQSVQLSALLSPFALLVLLRRRFKYWWRHHRSVNAIAVL